MKQDPILIKSIDTTEPMLHDAAYLPKASFIKKYKVKVDSPLSIESVYKKLREYIVNNKIRV